MAIIKGTDNDDLIFGGFGGNILTGGLGTDTFELTTIDLPTTPNTITDFERIEDTIQIDLGSASNLKDLSIDRVGNDSIISFSGTKLAIVKNTLDLTIDELITVLDAPTSIPTESPTTLPSTPILGITLANNLFTTDDTVNGFGIKAIAQKAGTKVNEIGIFAVDDATGKIGNLAPGSAGYLQAALDTARPIFSSLGGDFFSPTKLEIGLESNKTYEFFQIQDGSISDLQQQLATGKTPTNVLFSLADASGNSPIAVTKNTNNDGYKVSVNNDELVLNVVKLDAGIPNIPTGSKSQDSPQGRTIDLTDFVGEILKVDITTKSDAAYNNHIGFYAVEDAIGTIQLANGTMLKPSDANYAVEAVKSAILQAGKNDSKLDLDLAGGKNYAPVLIAQGSFNDFVSKNPTNGGDGSSIHAYFNYIGANTDRVDHFRLLGNNTFGAEDLYGGGDRDFNDLVVTATFK
jgi:Domain of unknown function (DUF4114)